MEDEPQSRLAALGLALATGLLLALASPGAASPVLAWVAWVPLFRAIAGERAVRGGVLGFVAGAAFTSATLSWAALPVAAHASVGVVLAFALVAGTLYALPFAVYGAALAFESRRRGRFGVALAALLWPALEWTRTLGPLAAPWNLLGDSQPAWSAASQIAEAAGVYGIGATIVLVNAAVHVATTEHGPSARRALATASATVVVLLLVGVALRERAAGGAGRTLRVGVVQPSRGAAASPLETALELSRGVAARGAEVVVWPESAAPLLHAPARRPVSPETDLARVARLAAEIATPVVVSVEGLVEEAAGLGSIATSRNRVLLLDGNGEIAATYDKRILVPFGETVPEPAAARGIRAIAGGERPIRAGERPGRFDVAGLRAAILVCWEAIFPGHVAGSVAGTDLAIVLTNDDWLGSSFAAEQHFAMAALRAVETRRPVVRAARSGVSAVVAADGTTLARTSFGDVGEIVVDVPLGPGPWVDPRGAAAFPVVAGLAAAGLLVYAGRSRRDRAPRLPTFD